MKPSIANCKTCHHRGGNTCYAHIEGGDGPRTIDTDGRPDWCPVINGDIGRTDYARPFPASCKGCDNAWPMVSAGGKMQGGRTNSCAKYRIYPTDEGDRVCPYYTSKASPKYLDAEIASMMCKQTMPSIAPELADLVVKGINTGDLTYWRHCNTHNYSGLAEISSTDCFPLVCNNCSIQAEADGTFSCTLYGRVGVANSEGRDISLKVAGLDEAKINSGMLLLLRSSSRKAYVDIPIAGRWDETGRVKGKNKPKSEEDEECEEECNIEPEIKETVKQKSLGEWI